MIGLKQQIEQANSETAIRGLLDEGANYLQASDKTKRRWSRVAARRIKYLQLLKEATK